MKEKKPISKEEIARLVKQATARLATPEGQEELRKAFERGKKEAKRIREVAKPGPEIMKIPFSPVNGGCWSDYK